MARPTAVRCKTFFERYPNQVGAALENFFVKRRNTDPEIGRRNLIAMIAKQIGTTDHNVRRWAIKGSVDFNALTREAANAFARLLGVQLEAMQIPRSRAKK